VTSRLQPDAAQKEVLDAKEAAEFLRIDKTFLYQQAKTGNIPGRRIGTVWRFSRKTLERWLDGDLSSSAPVGEGAK
jgi:excisionase family DNA binding protein